MATSLSRSTCVGDHGSCAAKHRVDEDSDALLTRWLLADRRGCELARAYRGRYTGGRCASIFVVAGSKGEGSERGFIR